MHCNIISFPLESCLCITTIQINQQFYITTNSSIEKSLHHYQNISLYHNSSSFYCSFAFFRCLLLLVLLLLLALLLLATPYIVFAPFLLLLALLLLRAFFQCFFSINDNISNKYHKEMHF